MDLIPLEEAHEHPAEAVGGKARSLGAVAAGGLPVPPGVVVPAPALASGSVPAHVLDALEAWAGDRTLAVRSSAPVEDGSETSFAGRFETVLGVRGPSVEAAVLACVRSGERAYAEAGRGMAVLVQELVAADLAGVLFTIDPRDGREDRMVIEAVPGLADRLASGEATPDRFVVDRVAGVVVERDGSGRVDPPPELVARLRQTSDRLEELFGRPLDVEWAARDGRVWVVQARPITAVAYAPAPGVWTSANFREILPGVVTALSASCSLEHDYERSLSAFLREIRILRPDERATEGRRFYGHLYWRVDTLKRVVSRIPGYRERDFDVTVGISPTYEGDGHRTRYTPGVVLRGVPILLGLRRAYRRWPAEGAGYRDRTLAEAWPPADLETLDEAALAALARDALEAHWRANRVAHTVTYLAAQAQDEFRAVLRAAGGLDPPPSEGALVGGLGRVATSGPPRAVTEVAEAIRADPRAARAVAGSGSWAEMVSSVPPAASRMLEAFLGRLGYISAADEELARPRWEEDPDLAHAVVRAAVLGPRPTHGDAEAAAAEEEARVLAALPRRRRRAFRRKLEAVRRWAWWREEVRDVISRVFRRNRLALLAYGRHLAARAVLGAPEDVFRLTRSQLLDLIAGRLPEGEAARLSAAEHSLERRFRAFRPPEVLGAEVVESAPPAGASRGVPCSPGVAEGPAIVLTDVAGAGRLRTGDVLVAPFTNPGWTPLFAVAGALVTEEGGLLSHCSIVARERGIPAVVQVRGATTRFRDGQRLRVDGDRGTVTIVGEER